MSLALSVALGAACQAKSAAPASLTTSAPVGVPQTLTARSAESSFAGEVEQLAEREFTLPPAREVNGDYFRAAASGTLVSMERDANGTSLAMDVGTSSAVKCVVYAEPKDAGGTLRAMVQSMQREGRAVNVLPGSLSVRAERPIQRLDVLYREEEPSDGLGAGVLKLAWIGDFVHPVLCYHDELGYKEGFEAVVSRLADSLVTPGAPAAARIQISRSTLRGMPVGFEYVGEWAEGDGTASAFKRTTYALRSLPYAGSYSARDTVSTVHYDGLQRMQGGRWVVATDGVLSQNLTLEKRQGAFRVAGSAFGKPVSARLKELPDAEFDHTLSERIAQSTPFTATRTVYAPLDMPEKVLEERIEHGQVPGSAELVRGDERVHIVLDADGRIARREVGEGAATLLTELVYTRSAPHSRTN